MNMLSYYLMSCILWRDDLSFFFRTFEDKSKSSYAISINIKMPSNIAFCSSDFNHKPPTNLNDYYSLLHTYSLKKSHWESDRSSDSRLEANSPRYPVVRQVISSLCSAGANLWCTKQENCLQRWKTERKAHWRLKNFFLKAQDETLNLSGDWWSLKSLKTKPRD